MFHPRERGQRRYRSTAVTLYRAQGLEVPDTSSSWFLPTTVRSPQGPAFHQPETAPVTEGRTIAERFVIGQCFLHGRGPGACLVRLVQNLCLRRERSDRPPVLEPPMV